MHNREDDLPFDHIEPGPHIANLGTENRPNLVLVKDIPESQKPYHGIMPPPIRKAGDPGYRAGGVHVTPPQPGRAEWFGELEEDQAPAHLPTDAEARKAIPITTGVIDYFPDALAAVAVVSRQGNEQHNPGQPLHWSKGKSTDHADCIARHLIDRGKFDADGTRHSAKLAWRALALLQREIEAERVSTTVERK